MPEEITTSSGFGKGPRTGTGWETGYAGTNGALLPQGDMDGLRRDWREIQTMFVDEPRTAVERADELVASVIQKLADAFAEQRARLNGQTDGDSAISTEDLRLSMQRDRAFLDRLLEV